jgi:hypothetical protein
VDPRTVLDTVVRKKIPNTQLLPELEPPIILPIAQSYATEVSLLLLW